MVNAVYSRDRNGMVRSREWEKQGQETGGAGEGQEQVSGERWALPSASSGEAGVQEPWEA